MHRISKRIVYWTLFGLWAGVIFSFSAQPDTVSTQQSGVFARWLETTLHTLGGTGTIFDGLHVLVRKGAHFGVYLVLGALAQRSYAHTGAGSRGLCFAVALLSCALYAATDEIHQFFVPGRAMMLTDVLIDTMGAAVGAAGLTLLTGRRR